MDAMGLPQCYQNSHVPGYTKFPLILRNSAHLDMLFVSQFYASIALSLCKSVQNEPLAQDEAPLADIYRISLCVQVIAFLAIAIGPTWIPPGRGAHLIEYRKCELEESCPRALLIRNAILDVVSSNLESIYVQHLHRWGKKQATSTSLTFSLAFLCIQIVRITGLDQARDQYVTMPALWIIAAFISLSFFLALQAVSVMYLLNVFRVVLECSLRMKVFTNLFYPNVLNCLLAKDFDAEQRDALLMETQTWSRGRLHSSDLQHLHLRYVVAREAPLNSGNEKYAAFGHIPSMEELFVWNEARSFVQQYDCNNVLASTSFCFGGLLIFAALGLLGLVLNYILFYRDIDPEQFVNNGGITVMYSFGALTLIAIGVSYRMLVFMLQVFEAYEQQDTALQSIQLHSNFDSNENMWQFVSDLRCSMSLNDKVPRVLYIPVRPTLLNIINGYVAAAILAMVSTLASMFIKRQVS